MYTFRLTQEQVDEILGRAMRLSDRYRLMKKAGATEAEIKKAFDTPEEMSVFSWEGEKDTIMTPMDSIRYYKFFLRTTGPPQTNGTTAPQASTNPLPVPDTVFHCP